MPLPEGVLMSRDTMATQVARMAGSHLQGLETARWLGRAVVAGALGSASLVAAAIAPASADVVDISRYDILDSPVSGSGGWGHVYDGTITPTGVDPVQGGTLATYASNPVTLTGSGTLNDGVISTSFGQTHLFFTGSRAHPVITLHLDVAARIDTIEIFGGNIDFNAIPGALDGMTVEIGGQSVSVSTLPFGDPAVNDRILLTGTPLSDIVTDTITLRAPTASLFGNAFDQFSIAEIQVNGRPSLPTPLEVAIDIVPGEGVTTVSASSRRDLPVAIISTPAFDATQQVDRSTLTFGRSGLEQTRKICLKPVDVTGDGRRDLICTFSVRGTGLQAGDTTAILRGATTDHAALRGSAPIRVTR
jgi:hypothetical protein